MKQNYSDSSVLENRKKTYLLYSENKHSSKGWA